LRQHLGSSRAQSKGGYVAGGGRCPRHHDTATEAAAAGESSTDTDSGADVTNAAADGITGAGVAGSGVVQRVVIKR
jgi:hypothetical protein